jgi:hypothetical protein
MLASPIRRDSKENGTRGARFSNYPFLVAARGAIESVQLVKF